MARKYTDTDKKLPEATAKRYTYTGQPDAWRFIHQGEEFCLGDVTPEKAGELIEEGFDYLVKTGKEPKEEAAVK